MRGSRTDGVGAGCSTLGSLQLKPSWPPAKFRLYPTLLPLMRGIFCDQCSSNKVKLELKVYKGYAMR